MRLAHRFMDFCRFLSENLEKKRFFDEHFKSDIDKEKRKSYLLLVSDWWLGGAVNVSDETNLIS